MKLEELKQKLEKLANKKCWGDRMEKNEGHTD